MQNDVKRKLFGSPYINSDEMLVLVGKYQRARKQETKDMLRNKIFENNARMIRRAVCRHPSIKKDDIEDAFNVCVINFLYGLDKFDLKMGFKLSTYIMHWIKRGIQEFLYSNNIIHINRGAFGNSTTRQRALNARNGVLTYLDDTYLDWKESIGESFYDPTLQEDPEATIVNRIQDEQLFEMVNKNLTKREVIIIRFKYFEAIRWTSADFEPVLKITHSWVNVIEKKALFKLRKLLQNKDITGLFPVDPRAKEPYIPSEQELQDQHERVTMKIGHGKGMKFQ